MKNDSLTPQQKLAVEWLEAQKVRIGAALEARYMAFCRALVANRRLTWVERDRLADAKEDSLIRLMKTLMRGAAQAHVDGGAPLAEEYLSLALPVVSR